MYNRMRERYQAIMAVGRQFTRLAHRRGNINDALEELKRIGRKEQQPIIRGLERAFREEVSVDEAALGKSIGPYGILQRLIFTIKKEGGDPIAVLPQFDQMLLSINEQTRALWVSISGFLAYMTSVLLIAGIVFTILMIFVIPQFEAMFTSFGAQLPALTNFITKNNAVIFYSVLFGFGLLIFFLMIIVLYVFDISGRLLPFSQKLQYAPFMRNVTFTYNRLLSLNYAQLLISAGLQDNRAIELAAEIANDAPLTAVATGDPISQARRDRALSDIAMAKDADNLKSELDYHINDQNYQLASDFTYARQKALFALHILLALVIGIFVIAMYLPIFKMGEVG